MTALFWGVLSFAGAFVFTVSAALLLRKGRVAWIGQFVLVALVGYGIWILSSP